MSGQALGGITAAAGLGIALFGAGKAGDRPTDRDLGTEFAHLPYNQQLTQAQRYVKAQIGDDQDYSNAVLGAQPLYTQGAIKGQNAEADNFYAQYQGMAGNERQATKYQRGADLRDLQRYGPGLSAAYAASSPGYAAILASLNGGAGQPSPLLNDMNGRARDLTANPYSGLTTDLMGTAGRELALGSSLSPEQSRGALQTANNQWSARGLGMSTGAVAAGILNRDNYGQQLLAQREAAAANAAQIGQGDVAQAHSYGLGVQGANQALLEGNRNFTLNAANATNAPLNAMMGSRAHPDTGALLGAMGMAPTAGQISGVMSQAPTVFQGAQSLVPLYNYGSDIYNTLYNAKTASSIRTANAYTSLGGGMISRGGQMMGGGGGGGMGSMAGMMG